ncbi:hypothetical protein H0H87_001214 [Tephrocybe sp. NHM501043]|nr:hypothetical protein H0H87_001214 [Tephrocybe sp. NHM501043]
MPFPQLPVELLDAICQLAQPVDLAVLSRTTTSLHSVAQRRLYRHLSISTNSHNLSAIVTLANKSGLAQHVRTFSLRVDSSTIFNSYLQLVGTALSRMTELVSLDLFVDSGASWMLSKAKCTFPRLTHFASSFSFDAHVAEFLSKTEALLELEVDSNHSDLEVPVPALPTESIPHLSQLVGSPHVARVVVPGRPVASIHLPSGDLTEEDVVTLAKSTSHVVVFGATTNSPPLQLLESLVQHMPRLIYLRLMTTCDFSEAPQPSFYEQTAKSLTSLSDLQGFELAGLHWGSAEKDPQEKGRVWQSQPLVSDIVDVEHIDVDSDLFYVY